MWSEGEMLVQGNSQQLHCFLRFDDAVVQGKMKIIWYGFALAIQVQLHSFLN